MTDYCISACQRHRPAAIYNQYTPGYLQTCTNSPEQAYATRVIMRSHTHTHTLSVQQAHEKLLRSEGVNAHQAHTVCERTCMCAHKRAWGSELESQAVPNSVAVLQVDPPPPPPVF